MLAVLKPWIYCDAAKLVWYALEQKYDTPASIVLNFEYAKISIREKKT